MTEKIEILFKKIVLRDIEIRFKEKLLEGFIIPDIVFDLLKEIEKKYEENN